MSKKQDSIALLKEIKDSEDVKNEIEKIKVLYAETDSDYAKLMREGAILVFLKEKYNDIEKYDKGKENTKNAAIESKIKNDFSKSEQAKKIFTFFRHQIILKYFISHAIEYINLVQTLMKPENMVKLIGLHNQFQFVDFGQQNKLINASS